MYTFCGTFGCVCAAWIWIRCAITLPLLSWWKMQRPDSVYFVIERNEITRNLWQTFKCSFALLPSLHFNGMHFTLRFSWIFCRHVHTDSALQMHLYFVGFHILSNNFPNCFDFKFTHLRFPVWMRNQMTFQPFPFTLFSLSLSSQGAHS